MKGFPFHSGDDVRRLADELGLTLPWSEDVSILAKPVAGQGFTLPNALCAQPMEGNDSTEDGAPTDLTIRRYAKLAAGGSGLIWLEAVAVSQEARANPRQLMLTRDNLPAYRRLAQAIYAAAEEAGWPRPLLIVQLTHSGRNTTQRRVAASAHPVMNPHQGLPMDYPLITDEELKAVQAQFADAAQMLREAGYDGVDIKCCHLYLFSELLGAATRPGPYGGDFEGRVRMELETAQAVRDAAGSDWVYAARMNAYDGMEGGFCTGEGLAPQYDEAVALAKRLQGMGVSLFNITMGTPYFNPHVNRPYASHPKGEGYDQPEPPLAGVIRLLEGCAVVQKAVPEAVCVATGFSYLRQFAPQVAAGLLEEGGARSVGFGRGWLAYPEYAKDILTTGRMDAKRCCVTCGYCTYLMRRGQPVGCPVRDEAYTPYLKAMKAKEAQA